MTRWTVEHLRKSSWFRPLQEQIQRELDGLTAKRHNARPALEKEREQLCQQVQGWSLTLAKLDLCPAVRATIEKDLEATLRRQQVVEDQLGEDDARRRRAGAVVDAVQVVDRLNRLADVLAAQNPSRTNLELSLHTDAIRCYRDGRVVVRTCKLGALAGSAVLLARPHDVPRQAAPSDGKAIAAKPRRRALRRVAADDGNQAALQAAAHQAADVDRFACLRSEWFWEDTLQVPRRMNWPVEHAATVAAKNQETEWSLPKLAEHFSKSIPTIRLALLLAEEQDERGNNVGQPTG
jgi:hypothetical protein